MFDEPIRINMKVAENNLTIEIDKDEPRRTTRPVIFHDCWRPTRNHVMPKRQIQRVALLVFPKLLKGVFLEPFKYGLNDREPYPKRFEHWHQSLQRRETGAMTARAPMLKAINHLQIRAQLIKCQRRL